MMTLLETIEKLPELNREYTIYAAKPWTPESAAVVAEEPPRGGLPAEAAERKLSYFLEVFIARDFLDDWQAGARKQFTAQERCQRLIDYAISHAID